MVMGAARTGDETRQIEMVSLDELVAGGDGYRRVERVISWAAVRAVADPFTLRMGARRCVWWW